MESTPLLHDIPSTAALLGTGRSTVYEEIKAGRLAAVKIGRRTLVKHAELERFVGTLQPATQAA